METKIKLMAVQRISNVIEEINRMEEMASMKDHEAALVRERIVTKKSALVSEIKKDYDIDVVLVGDSLSIQVVLGGG